MGYKWYVLVSFWNNSVVKYHLDEAPKQVHLLNTDVVVKHVSFCPNNDIVIAAVVADAVRIINRLNGDLIWEYRAYPTPG